MRRLDILAPHRGAVRSLLRSARRNPPLALALNALALRSQRWMLTPPASAPPVRSACCARKGWRCCSPASGTWTRDDDGDQARTMAALDRALARGERLAGLLDDLCAIPRGCAGCGRAGSAPPGEILGKPRQPERRRRFTASLPILDHCR